jgi:Uma2 family endonuclease
MVVTRTTLDVKWEKLPDDFPLDNEPVDNLTQPLLATGLTESLELATLLPENSLVATNFGLVATLHQKIVIKAPDWVYIPAVVPVNEVRRSYTPHLEGEVPAIVMEFLSETEGGEYSIKPTYPPGKWYFYEQILKVPQYAIFDPESGLLEFYQLNDAGQYQLQQPDQNQHHWVAQLHLFLGVWQGTKQNRTGYWLRWWDEQGTLLAWGVELVEQERQRTETERQRAETERQRAERLANQLRALGIDPDEQNF